MCQSIKSITFLCNYKNITVGFFYFFIYFSTFCVFFDGSPLVVFTTCALYRIIVT